MSKKNSRKMRRKRKKSLAGKIPPSQPVLHNPSGNSSPERVSDQSQPDGFSHLHPRCLDPEDALAPLPRPQAHRLTRRVMKQLQALQPTLNMAYWKEFTSNFFRSSSARVLVNPARAGSGKSTWIRAFLLTLAQEYASGNELAEYFGGVLLILQKVEDLNAITQEVNQSVSASQDQPLMVALQSLTRSGQTYQLCQNPRAQNYRDCVDCPHNTQCPLYHAGQQGKQAYILGATQKRFYDLRSSGALDEQLLFRTQADGTQVRRRFLLFDEKPELYQMAVLDLSSLNALSTRLEELPARRGTQDCQVSALQDHLSYLGVRPLQMLRRQTVILLPDGHKVGEQLGVCTLEDRYPERVAELQASLIRVLGQNNEEVQTCLAALMALHQGKECLFSKVNSFHICYTWDGLDCLQKHQVLIFDATAEVDGDYCHNPHIKLLPSPKLPDMHRVVFHLYTHSKLNLSRSAVNSKLWLPQGMCALVEEILVAYPGKTFLCAYKQGAPRLADMLSSQAKEQLAWMQHPDHPDQRILPYFGGTNGSNAFRDCTNVILLGYPRLSPDVYLERCWAAWEQAGIREQIRLTQEYMRHSEHPWPRGDNPISLVDDYEARHLASRMEQEIYRCKLRDATARCEIHIFLFCPPKKVWKLLLSRFPGCQVEHIPCLPDCVQKVQFQQQRYRGEPTARAKLMQFLESWDGAPIRVADLRAQLDITPSAWKDLMKQMSASSELEKLGILRAGRGPHTTWRRPAPPS